MKLPATEVQINGMRKFNDVIEGNSHNFTKFFIREDLDGSKGNAKGASDSEYAFGDATEYDKWPDSFPMAAIAEFQVVTTGKISKLSIVSLRPKQTVKPA